jgi:hypothetical protein
MDILSPWAYVCIFIASVLMIASAVIILRGIPVKDEKMGNCDKVDALSID